MDFRNRASSNFSSNTVSESGSMDFVEDLVRLQAEAAGDDFFLDLGDAAEDRLWAAVAWLGFWRARETRSSWWPCTGGQDRSAGRSASWFRSARWQQTPTRVWAVLLGRGGRGGPACRAVSSRAGNVKLTGRLPGGRVW